MSELYSSLETLVQWQLQTKQRKLVSQQRLQSQLAGNHHTVRKGRGMEFSEVRQYQAGDDIRHIDWRVSARTQITHTKLFSEELERPVVCVVEQTPWLFFGSQVRFKTSQALNLMALIGWSTLNHKDRFGALVFNHLQAHWAAPKAHAKPLMNLFHQSLALQQMLTRPQKVQADIWLNQLHFLQKNLRPGTKVFLIGDALQWQATHFSQLQQLKRHNQLSVLHVYDQLEAQLPKLGQVPIWDGQTYQRINAQDTSQLAAYQQAHQQQIDGLQQQLQRIKIPLARISAQQSPIDALVQQGILQ